MIDELGRGNRDGLILGNILHFTCMNCPELPWIIRFPGQNLVPGPPNSYYCQIHNTQKMEKG
jgi:hypothetical protein